MKSAPIIAEKKRRRTCVGSTLNAPSIDCNARANGVSALRPPRRRRFSRRTSSMDWSCFVRVAVIFFIGTTLLLSTEIDSFYISSVRQSRSTHSPNRRTDSTTATATTTTTNSWYQHKQQQQQKLSSSLSVCMVQKLEPLTQTSDDRRSRAITAMNRAKVENALIGIDAQTIGMLSSKFLAYPSNRPNHKGKNNNIDPTRKLRKGRPESVLGAMTQSTMARYLEHQSALQALQSKNGGLTVSPSDLELMVIAPYMENIPSSSSSLSAAQTAAGTSSVPQVDVNAYEGTTRASSSSTLVVSRPRRKIKGTRSTMQNDGELPTAYTSGATTTASLSKPRGRKAVFKNVPKGKHPEQQQLPQQEQSAVDDATLRPPFSKSKGITNGMDIQQYYRTELLTSDEEYALGMKIQFMDKCEQVHEGLASAMNRLPTIVEWAAACGFTDAEPNFVPTEADEQLRPVGSDAMFDDIDPNMFVGNGLAHQTGPGSGRGRVKRVPPLGLKDYFDDSEYRRQLKSYLKNRGKDKSIPRPRKSELVRPINRGMPTDFIEMLMTAHEAKQRMVQSNMRLVVSIARKYYNAGVTLQDLVQEGSLGLSRAAEKFEPKKGFKFSTYASWWIQQAVFRSIAYHSRTIRLPVHVHNLLNRVRKVRQTLQSELGRPPTNEEIAGHLGMSRQKFNKMLHLTKQSISLEAPKYLSNPKDLGHESDDSLGETLSKSSILEDEATPQKAVDHGLFHDDLKNIMKILDEDEHRVICARYGLHDGLTRTVTTVAAQMKQSKAWVRSQECRALRKLRRPWYEKKLKEHQDALAC